MVFNRKSKSGPADENPKWLGLSLIAFVLLVTGAVAQAQQPTKIPRIGFLVNTGTPYFKAFHQRLRELGYVEGQNLIVETRYAEGKRERLPALAKELVGLGVDIIVAAGPAISAAAKATNKIPIVAGSGADLIAMGLAASLARPGGNVTGTTNIDMDMTAKRLELLKESVPKISRAAILHGGADSDLDEVKETEIAGRSLGVKIQALQVKEPSQFANAYAAMTKERADALIIFHGSVTLRHRKILLELASKNRLPTMCGQALWADDGGLLSYAVDDAERWRRAAVFVDKILKGAKPADLPVEQPMKFEFVINLKTATQIGLTIPQSVLFRADKVIK
jgi:putative tryptophan/tyrosine transport system substrate-binding protein